MSAAIEIVSASAPLLDAAIGDPDRLAALLDARVAPGWAVFPESLAFAKKQADGGVGWWEAWGTKLFVTAQPRVLVGVGGYKGPPTPEGIVEIGYAIAEGERGRGLATAAARELARRAFADPAVRAVDAQTLPEANASTRVLEKIGMARVGEAHDDDVGKVWQWRLARPG